MMDNRLLFILPGLPDFVPYVYNYFKIVEQAGVGYDVVCWNRRGDRSVVLPKNHIIYDHPTNDVYSSLRKMWEIYGFYRFVMKKIHGKQYRAVFTYTIADSVLFSRWLSNNYSGRFVFDIRDYSPMVSSRLTRFLVKRLLQNSAMNVISSEGFLQWLPKEYRYIVCHNTDIEKVRWSMANFKWRQTDDNLRVLTIGAIRNAESNIRIIDALGNKEGVRLIFAGDGDTAALLKKHCEKNNYNNVTFYGRYRKEEEDEIVNDSDMINIIMPHDMVADYLMSNRFYLSVRMRKPMILNEGNFQAEQATKYDLGLIVYPDEDIYAKLMEYWRGLNRVKYNENCINYLKIISNDLDSFAKGVLHVINN